jgi:hypothetical protein
MRRARPYVTLLAGLALAAVVLGLSVRAKLDDAKAVAQQQAPATASPPPDTASQPPATASPADLAASPSAKPSPSRPPAAPLNVTWAGEVDGAGTLAITAKGDQAIAYLCDGRRLEVWFLGTARAGRLDLKGPDGARLAGTFGNGRAAGTVIVQRKRLDFDLPAVKNPSGLYRATATVRGAKVEAGWIVLPNGEQVGLGTVDDALVMPSRLGVASGTATVGGLPVTAAPAAGELR